MAVLYIRDPKTGNKAPIRSIKGENGDRMFVRFSAYADGTDMSETWDAERDYMGIAFAADAPTDKAAYQWIRLASLSFGRYAEEGSAEKYLFFVGGGTGEDDRCNALTLDEDGNLHVTGEVTFGEDNFSPRKKDEELDERIDGVRDALDAHRNAAIRMASFTYTGTGTSGRTHAHGETFDFPPKFIMLQSDVAGESAFCVLGGTCYMHRVVGGDVTTNSQAEAWANAMIVTTSEDGKTVSWYHERQAEYQMNVSGRVYRGIAFG